MKFHNTIRFIDCGANQGQSIEWAKKAFKGYNLKIDSFEPNPELFKGLKKKYTKQKNINIHELAISDKNSEESFYLQNWGAKTGSSLIIDKESTYQELFIYGKIYYERDGEWFQIQNFDLETNKEILWSYRVSPDHEKQLNEQLNLYNKITVKTIDLSEWLILNCNFVNETVVLKLDIEGAEYKVIPRLFEKNLHQLIDAWLVEITPLAKFPEEYAAKLDDSLEHKTRSIVKHYFDWSKPKECEKIFANFMKTTVDAI